MSVAVSGIAVSSTAKEKVEAVNGLVAKNGGPTVKIDETATPTAVDSVGQIYTKSDNKLYFQSGAGVEYEITMS